MEKCHYCDVEAVTHCSKFHAGWTVVECSELVPGDKVRRLGDHRPRKHAVVLSIIPSVGGIDYKMYYLAVYGNKTRLAQFGANSFQRIQAIRNQPCATPCCENHHRDLAENHRPYCATCCSVFLR